MSSTCHGVNDRSAEATVTVAMLHDFVRLPVPPKDFLKTFLF